MSYIKEYITNVNAEGRKVLSVFLTAGFPSINGFVNLAKSVLDSGADMIELGMPFNNPLADGPVIQNSSLAAIANGVNYKTIFQFSEKISQYSPKPVILMGYANQLVHYGVKDFFTDSLNSGAKGIIIPDVPLEEYNSFFKTKPAPLEAILLAAPTSTDARLKQIDSLSGGFVYCVSIAGTTGSRISSANKIIVKNMRSSIKKNKMLAGFGISKPEDIESYSPYCDGVIVGSAVIKMLHEKGTINTLRLIRSLSNSCR